MVSPFTVVDAGAISAELPPELLALLVTQREVHGVGVTLCAVGDIGLSGRASITARAQGAAVLFADVTSVLRSAEITFGNLESPLAGQLHAGRMFAASPSGADNLSDAGFRVIHLANNHVGEYGRPGLAATLTAVQSAGLMSLGAGWTEQEARRVVRTDSNGIRIGWLGCGRTLLAQDTAGECYWEFDETTLLDAVAKERRNVDVLIVSIHIGLMYVDYPRPDHKKMAERLLAVGADIVLMHHAHVLQGIEITPCGKVCCFNLGNFLYDWQEGDVAVSTMLREQNEGGVFRFVLDRDGVAQLVVLPTWIDDDCRVRWATGERGRAILERLVRISRSLEGDFASEFQRQRAERNMGLILRVAAYHARRLDWRYFAKAFTRVRLEHARMLCGLLASWLRFSRTVHPSSGHPSSGHPSSGHFDKGDS